MILPSTSTDPVADGCQILYKQINTTYSQLQRLLDYGTTLIWDNPNGATPQTVVSTLGPNAATIFILSGVVCGVLTTIDGTARNPMPAGWSFAAGSDGAIVLTPPSNG